MVASLANPVVRQYGFTNGSGALANLVDHDDATFWAPLADGFDSHVTPPVADSGLVVVGANCPAIEFDFGDQARIPAFFAKVQGPSSLGQCFLICSQLPATSTADVVQSGDLWAGGMYTVAQMNSNQALF